MSNIKIAGLSEIVRWRASYEPLDQFMKRIAIALTVAGVLATVALWVAAALEFEFPFWPTLWLA